MDDMMNTNMINNNDLSTQFYTKLQPFFSKSDDQEVL